MATYDVTVARVVYEWRMFRVTVGDVGTGSGDIVAAGVAAAEADWQAGEPVSEQVEYQCHGYYRVEGDSGQDG